MMSMNGEKWTCVMVIADGAGANRAANHGRFVLGYVPWSLLLSL